MPSTDDRSRPAQRRSVNRRGCVPRLPSSRSSSLPTFTWDELNTSEEPGACRGTANRSPREERAGDLLAALTELFLAKGYDKTAMADISAVVTVAKGHVYW
ncbi:helix-turn-helix domain-containing protein [Streptomyces sp. NPDC005574]|uniref:helix-turn-helix domain-containing protein n=1 Tax=Streptomyces sp. NPDC005574 TaxID=3156891 RepID=UPI0033A7EF5C